MAWPGLTDLLLVADRDRAAVPDLAMAGGQRLAEVLLSMRTAMEELSEAPVRHLLGGALTGAQNEGRLSAAVAADIPGSVFADETRDANTCQPCRDIDERFLGMTDEMDSVRRHYPGGGFGGYVGCEGRERCRGTIRIEWPEGLDPVDPPDPAGRDDDEVVEPNTPEFEEAMRELNEQIAEIERRAADRPKVKRPPRREVVKVADVDDDYQARQAELRALIAREDEAADHQRHNKGGSQGKTEVVNLPDRSRFVSKRIFSYDDHPGQTEVAQADTDKEELANLVARAVGVDAPALVRAGPTHIYLEFVKGRLGADLELEDKRAVMASDAGHLVGVLDVLIGNTDRHGGNWLVRDGKPVPIDHGYAWNPLVMSRTTSPFAEPFISPFDYQPRPSNPLTPADVAVLRERIALLRPDFDRLGRGSWYANTLRHLDELEAGAAGDRDRIKR